MKSLVQRQWWGIYQSSNHVCNIDLFCCCVGLQETHSNTNIGLQQKKRNDTELRNKLQKHLRRNSTSTDKQFCIRLPWNLLVRPKSYCQNTTINHTTFYTNVNLSKLFRLTHCFIFTNGLRILIISLWDNWQINGL